jgi:hypothetical protein
VRSPPTVAGDEDEDWEKGRGWGRRKYSATQLRRRVEDYAGEAVEDGDGCVGGDNSGDGGVLLFPQS